MKPAIESLRTPDDRFRDLPGFGYAPNYVDDLPGFWQAIWDWFEIESPTPHRAVLEAAVMPGAKWFAGAQINYARQVLRHADAAHAQHQRQELLRDVKVARVDAILGHQQPAREALDDFVRAAAIEMPRGIRINCVSPGLLEESAVKYDGFFPGHVPVTSARVGIAFTKCVEGAINGQVVTVD
mgnify:CR=1 FL=1